MGPGIHSIITAGRTAANKNLRFGVDRPLNASGRRSVCELAASLDDRGAMCGPELATRESAALLSRDVAIDQRLRTLDVGRWAGLAPEQIDPGALQSFFTDVRSCPHGGESIDAFVARILAWWSHSAQSLGERHLVVAMPIAQALIAGDGANFFAVEVAPAHHYRV